MTLLLDSVTLTYPDGDGRLTALDAVSVSAEPGELVGVVGPSGSGKSSLLAVAATLIRPDSGRVVVGGRDVSDLSLAGLATVRRRHVGIVFQQPSLLPSLTVREQLEVVTRLGAGSRDSTTRAGERADELLEAVGLTAYARRRPHQLSGGQRQRVSIARALMGAPEVLLVDEPTSALDHSRGAEVVRLLRRLTTELGTATLLVTHEVEHLKSADRVVEVRDGRVRSAARV